MERRRSVAGIGLILLVLGLMFLLSSLGYGRWLAWSRWWPLILIALGIWLLVRREAPGPPVPASAPPTLPVPSDAAAPAETTPPGGPIAAQSAQQRRRSPTGAIILIGIGAAFLLQRWVGGHIFPAVVLIAIGIALLLRDRPVS
ncbi:MAG: DUF5668 domain-containing protein [Armatimonadota bacterium]|nr:DUF5668 domain-containing protein [Armatimonadota bacterium]MDR7452244.1 DUF5668 domain-containing protein [Armatimonadota bacterium]MDR7466661.1 DUF5668 domain-containing protein [Armatimonadota bacterium]MDR7492865.1 DUF5668 domain-containing protein [Armatimonadota bacterium]MDR7498641.1 DUF5668 domain-containing protein [Armatimonadota bacterium]